MISVVIPCYNRENSIEEAVNSVLNQTYPHIEVIVVDDGSSDDSVKVVKEIIKHDNRLKIVELSKNSGANHARNVGIEKSIGDYVAFQDSDDIWINTKLEIQLSELKKYKMNIIGCSLSQNSIPKNINGVTKVLNYNDFLPNNVISTQTILARKELLMKYKFDENLPRFQDWELLLRISRNQDILYYSGKLVVQRITQTSITTDNNAGLEAIEIIKEKNESFFKENRRFQATYYYYMGILQYRLGFRIQGLKSFIIAISKYPYFQIFKTTLKCIISN